LPALGRLDDLGQQLGQHRFFHEPRTKPLQKPPTMRAASARRSIAAVVPETSPLDPLPVCLACWLARFGTNEPVPPPVLDWPVEACELCGADTGAGLYLLRGVPR
jgi:hypothetical protein